MTAPISKDDLRRRVRSQLGAVTPADRLESSRRANEHFSTLDIWKSAQTILFYAPLTDELDLRPLLHAALKQGRQIALPRYCPEEERYALHRVRDFSREMHPGKFGILEPTAQTELMDAALLDLALVPGVAFDRRGRRLGRGRGYYDRLLEKIGGVKCGVCFDFQVVDLVPVDLHDVRMEILLTPAGHHACGGS